MALLFADINQNVYLYCRTIDTDIFLFDYAFAFFFFFNDFQNYKLLF